MMGDRVGSSGYLLNLLLRPASFGSSPPHLSFDLLQDFDRDLQEDEGEDEDECEDEVEEKGVRGEVEDPEKVRRG